MQILTATSKVYTNQVAQLSIDNVNDLVAYINERYKGRISRATYYGLEEYRPKQLDYNGLEMEPHFRQVSYGEWLIFYDWGFANISNDRFNNQYDVVEDNE